MAAAAAAGASAAGAGALRHLTQAEAGAIDEELMSDAHVGYTSEQLMELAGLSCAAAVYKAYPPPRAALVLAGPGHNGGDGLIVARHLRNMGYERVDVHMPKRRDGGHLARLLHQLRQHDVALVDDLPSATDIDATFGVVVDAVFGFSFRGPALRAPFDRVIATLNETQRVGIVCVDVPSGWHVERGNGVDGHHGVARVDALVSLMAPKLCARHLPPTARHFLGGRFVPRAFADAHHLNLPQYPGVEQIVELAPPAPAAE